MQVSVVDAGRGLARLGSVMPASPTKTSSESIASHHAAADGTRPADGAQRTPNSWPRSGTSGRTGETGSPVRGSTCAVLPRASLL